MARWVKMSISVAIILFAVAAPSARAQYPAGGMGGGYGNGAAVGAGIGAAVGGAALVYWATHRQATVVGCVRPAGDGSQLVDERDHKTYSLVSGGESLKAGERVQLQGKKVKDSSGTPAFRVKKVARDLGSCDGEPSSGGDSGASRP